MFCVQGNRSEIRTRAENTNNFLGNKSTSVSYSTDSRSKSTKILSRDDLQEKVFLTLTLGYRDEKTAIFD